MTDLDEALGPLVRMLDPRPRDVSQARPIRDSVNIPLSELAVRTHELPPRHRSVCVVGADQSGEETVLWLRERGRRAELDADFRYGDTGNGRLWSPNEFLVERIADLHPGRALDLGCGTGRDAVALAALGWEVTAVDRLPDALDKGRDLAKRYAPNRAGNIHWSVADLEQQDWPFRDAYDLILAFYWLHKPALSRMKSLVAPGGAVLVEAFSETHRERHGKPGPDRVTNVAEAAELLAPLQIAFAEEGMRDDRHTVRVGAIRQS